MVGDEALQYLIDTIPHAVKQAWENRKPAMGSDGCLPTEKAEKGGHYSAFVSSGVAGHEGGDLLVRKTVEEINKMF